MRLKFLLFLSLAILFSAGNTAYGCLNEAGEDYVKPRLAVESLTAKEFYEKFVAHENRLYWQKKRFEYRGWQESSGFESGPNNLAVALIHLGETREAIKLLEDWENKTPGQYFTAANLGTAYELNGENQKALDWIKEGIKRNKDAHYGTEWLHVRILEAKLALEKQPDWTRRNSVLGVDPSTALPIDHLGEKKTLSQLEEALVYQLHERLEFVKPPDPIVAALLDDLSKVFERTRTPEHARVVKDLAASYAARSEAEKVYDPAAIENKTAKNYLVYGLIGTAAVSLIGAAYALFRKRKTASSLSGDRFSRK